MTLLDRYDEWDTKRRAIWEAEETGFEDSEYSLDDMGWSDDEGVELLEQFRPAYEGLLRAASNVIASWDQGDLAAAVRDLQQVAMLDTASSASRQHYIDTGRYMQEGEALLGERTFVPLDGEVVRDEAGQVLLSDEDARKIAES